MKEFVDKLIGRLEELREHYGKQSFAYNDANKTYEFVGREQTTSLIIEIVNELAEEYQSRVMIDEQYCWQTCVCTDKCMECNRLTEGAFDYYESIADWDEEYINTSTDSSTWIPCSERLPEEDGYYLVTTRFYHLHNLVVMGCNFEDGKWLYMDGDDEVLAWQPLPQPYKAGD